MGHTYELVIFPTTSSDETKAVRKEITTKYFPRKDEIIHIPVAWEFEALKAEPIHTETGRAIVTSVEHELGNKLPRVIAKLDQLLFQKMVRQDDDWQPYVVDAEFEEVDE